MVSPANQLSDPLAPTKAWDALPNAPPNFGHYRFQSVLGQGGMGTVYRAFHVNLHRPVAIKTLRCDRVRSAENTERFLREMHAIGQLDHPNVVRAYDGGERDGVLYLVMELLQGIDLNALVERRGALAVPDACELIRQAATGLDYVHRTLVHRDVKPSNLLLDEHGVVKILDLGLARLREADADERTPEGVVVGTYDYMAPEQALGAKELDGRADIYSLGCAFYKLLVGRAPFTGRDYSTAARKMMAHVHEPIGALPEVQRLPAALAEILTRMTEKDPARRPATAGAVAAALASWSSGSQPRMLLELAPPVAPGQPAPEFALAPTRLLELPAPTARTAKRWLPSIAALAIVAAAGFAWRYVALARQPSVVGPTALAALPASAEPPETLRVLDNVPPFTSIRLLDRPVLPIGYQAQDPGAFLLDMNRQALHALRREDLFFPLGTVSGAFTLEAGLDQASSLDQQGVFWGYSEVAKPNGEFAVCQHLTVRRRVDRTKGGESWSVERGISRLVRNGSGFVNNEAIFASAAIAPPHGEKALFVRIEHDRLFEAAFGRERLPELCADAINKHFETLPKHGALGVVAMGRGGTFANVRFELRERKQGMEKTSEPTLQGAPR